MRPRKILLTLAIGLILLGACAAPAGPPAERPTPEPTPAPTPMPTPEETPTPPPTPEATPIRVIFFGHPYSDPHDRATMEQVCREMVFSFETRDYKFVNDDANWFDEKDRRKFHIIIFPGGHSKEWFEKARPGGINEKGCENIRKFISKGGVCWAICYTGNAVFAKTAQFRGFTKEQTEAGIKLKPVVRKNLGWMVMYYGGEPVFRGTVLGPQQTN